MRILLVQNSPSMLRLQLWGKINPPIPLYPQPRRILQLFKALNYRPALQHDYPLTGAFTRPSSSWSLLDQLQQRGLVEVVTGPKGELERFLQSQPRVVYAGVDPTAASLHVGHLLPLMALLHFYLNGHHSIALVGMATASVGDPSGRTTERSALGQPTLKTNFESVWEQIDSFLTRAETYALDRGYKQENFGKKELKSNGEWLHSVGLIDFLQEVGIYVRVGQMLARESVKARMASKQGINYTEFTYQLLQSYDFWHLYKTRNCRVQVGGNDQFGNITAGIDLIARLQKSSSEVHETLDASDMDDTCPAGKQGGEDLAYGLTVPLLTTPSGEKFGKSAGNAVWLEESLTSPFELYQFFVRMPDEVVGPYLRIFTLLPLDEINHITEKHMQEPHLRTGQHVLAREVIHVVHGNGKAKQAEMATKLLFSEAGKSAEFNAEDIISTFKSDKQRYIELPRNMVIGEYVTKVAKHASLVETRNEAEVLVKQGGMYVGHRNGTRKVMAKEKVGEEVLLDGKVLLMRIGKGRFAVVRVV